MLVCRCDNCGAEEPARDYREQGHKSQWCEPLHWLRRFDPKSGKVIAVLCCFNCDKAYAATGGKGVGRK